MLPENYKTSWVLYNIFSYNFLFILYTISCIVEIIINFLNFLKFVKVAHASQLAHSFAVFNTKIWLLKIPIILNRCLKIAWRIHLHN